MSRHNQAETATHKCTAHLPERRKSPKRCHTRPRAKPRVAQIDAPELGEGRSVRANNGGGWTQALARVLDVIKTVIAEDQCMQGSEASELAKAVPLDEEVVIQPEDRNVGTQRGIKLHGRVPAANA